MATLCKVEKSELMAVHGEVTKELLNYIELIKSGSNTSKPSKPASAMARSVGTEKSGVPMKITLIACAPS